jgi:hypothetical protein
LTWRIALGLGFLAAGLRLPAALSSPLWQDEVASARILSEPTIPAVLRHVVRTESTPPLWYLLGWLIHKTGISVYDVRLLSVAEDCALVTLVVVAASRLVPTRFAALAGLLVALGAEFSAEGRWMRAYELIALVSLALAFAASAAAAQPSRRRLTALAAVVAPGSLTHYFFLFTVAGVVVWLTFDPAARQARRKTLLAVAAGLIPFVVWSPAFATQMGHRRYSWIGRFDLGQVLSTPLRLFTPFGSGAILTLGSLLALALAGFGAARAGQSSFGRLCVCLGIAPLVLAASIWLAGVRVYAVRNLIGIGPFLALVAVAGLAALPKPARLMTPIAVVLLATGSFVWAQRAHEPAFNRIGQALAAEGWQAGDAVLVFGTSSEFRSPLGWYLPGHPNLAVGNASVRAPTFVVGQPRQIRGLLLTSEQRSVASYVVARLLDRRSLRYRPGMRSVMFVARLPRTTLAEGRERVPG